MREREEDEEKQQKIGVNTRCSLFYEHPRTDEISLYLYNI
jgi:hypothetical protein